MAPKKPAQEPSPPSRPPEANGAPAKPAAAPATRVLPQRQGLHSPRISSAGQSSASSRPGTSDSQQRRGPEKPAAPPPEPETTLVAEQALQQQPVQPQPQQQEPQQPARSQPGPSQPASPRPTRPRSSASAPVSPISRPTSGTKRLTRSGTLLSANSQCHLRSIYSLSSCHQQTSTLHANQDKCGMRCPSTRNP